MPTYKVRLFYRGHMTHEIEADNKEQAIEKAKEIEDTEADFTFMPIIETLLQEDGNEEVEEITE